MVLALFSMLETNSTARPAVTSLRASPSRLGIILSAQNLCSCLRNRRVPRRLVEFTPLAGFVFPGFRSHPILVVAISHPFRQRRPVVRLHHGFFKNSARLGKEISRRHFTRQLARKHAPTHREATPCRIFLRQGQCRMDSRPV